MVRIDKLDEKVLAKLDMNVRIPIIKPAKFKKERRQL